MELPSRLEDWNYDAILDIIRQREYEPLQFDYKEVLNGRAENGDKDSVLESIRRTACSLANSSGGYIIFGIRDRSKPVNTLEERIVGIPLSDDLQKNFGNKVRVIQPDIHFEAIPKPIVLPKNPNRGVFVVYIPTSPLRPHMMSTNGVFYQRGEGGDAVIMSVNEVREQMLFTDERLKKLYLLRLEIKQDLEIATIMNQARAYVTHSKYRFDTNGFKSILAETIVLLPKANGLISKLLRIPVLAGAINISIQNTSEEDVNWMNFYEKGSSAYIHLAHEMSNIFNFIQELQNLCNDCEQILFNCFGEIE